MTLGVKSPVVGSEYAAYRAVLAAEALLPPEQWTFKRNPVYQAILEHVSTEQGAAYLSHAHNLPHWGMRARTLLCETAMANDRLGSPIKADYPSLGIFCSPTNLRYLCQALEILDCIERLGLDEVHVLEIGGGYGGLALYLHAFAALARVNLIRHTIIDVPEAGAIQGRFCREQGTPVRVVNATASDAVNRAMQAPWPPDRFLVSAYGFSEFSASIRDWYQDNVVRHCRHGYLVWNMIPVYPIAEGQTDEPEIPLTGPGNRLVCF